MSTFMAKPADIQRKWYIVDAANRPLGRTAAKVADLLRGKGKPEFTPHVDCGDHVVVINAEKAASWWFLLLSDNITRHEMIA